MKIKSIFVLLVVALMATACAPKSAPTAAPPTEAPALPAVPALPDGPYTIDVTSADFVAGVDNPYFPLTPGSTKVLEGMTENGLERIEIKVLLETREVMGIPATIRQDTVYIGGELVEDTFDWFAQDKAGNVWYLGEDVKNYENGQLTDTSGSWEAGVNGALPGVIMYADPAARLGETYYQEYYAGEAEDAAQLLSASESVTVAAGSFENVVKTFDFTPLDPKSLEHKYYAAGVGVVKNVNLVTGVIFELIEYTEAAASTEYYTVSLTPADFVAAIDNPYLPLIPGTKWVYEAHLEDGTVERNEIEVLTETRLVNGVSATVVHDLVYVGGQIVEETYDWYAQDKDGNVWYLGEEVDNYKDGVLVDHAGSWEWGKDGALPGIIMWADPSAHMNEEYYQEFYAGEAEDKGQVLSVNESASVPFGSFENLVKTYDFSSLDPALQEEKFYASGVGMVREISRNSGEEVVLIEFVPPSP